ncbi:BamA/TamA family outer membrane protein [Rhizorhapis sp. SPR117]|uniref:autotransporter assembly complex protein TamA n=1 Tax=Rhizorhapis sp. SPR117 TaxID=2912611 RepID=UPI001EFFD28E|nr:BamA/TamA family outer membrane protein [Rhizorhapis sp. SPR117]
MPLGSTLLDPQSPTESLPDLGVEWPDMNQPDNIEPMEAEEDAAGMNAEDAPPLETPVPVAPVDYVAEHDYKVVLRGLDGIEDDQFRNRFNELSVLREGDGDKANVAQINRRAKEDIALLQRLLRAKGYYDARVVSDILPAQDGGRLQVMLDTVPGPQYILDEVNLPGLENAHENSDALYKAFSVKSGDPVDADQIIAAQLGLTVALGENGYPFAKVDEPVVQIDHEARHGDLSVTVDPKGYRRFGRINIAGDDIFSARHIQRIARFQPGDPYNASDITDLRRALIATGLISSVSLTPKDAGDGETVDLAVALEPAPPRTVAGELGYGTGEGYRVEASWQHRNFFPPEGAMTFRGVAGTQEQSLSAIYRRNNYKRRDQVLHAQVSASNINRAAYDAKTLQVSASIERQTNIIFQKAWTWSAGAELLTSDERDSIGVDAISQRRTFFIAALPLNLIHDGSDDLLNPARGFRLGMRISPELSFQSGTFGYGRVQLDGSVYQPMGNRVVLAGRVRAGTIVGAHRNQIAPSRRYYAGGGGSVRGYGYQDIGPRDANGDPIGGRGLAEVSLEARIHFGNFGIVPFVDAGNISTDFLPDIKNFQVGAGLGVRYYSSFGPIRIDVGTPINPRSGDPRVAVYVSLGQAF